MRYAQESCPGVVVWMLLVAQNQVVMSDGTFFHHVTEVEESVGQDEMGSKLSMIAPNLGLGRKPKNTKKC
jgi:hypothetical protein